MLRAPSSQDDKEHSSQCGRARTTGCGRVSPRVLYGDDVCLVLNWLQKGALQGDVGLGKVRRGAVRMVLQGATTFSTTVWFTWWRSDSRPCTPRMKCSLVLPAPCPWYQGSVVVGLWNCELAELEIPLLGALVLTECSCHKAPACLLLVHYWVSLLLSSECIGSFG